MKTYSNKSNAKRAAKKAGLDIETLNFVEVDGQWGWEETLHTPAVEAEADLDEQDKDLLRIVGRIHCPHCGVHLSNGFSDYENQLDIAKQERNPEAKISHEFICLGCAEEFGKPMGAGTGVKIEKDRPEQNGVTRPSAGGKCRAIWDACDAYYKANKAVPMPKQMKEMAAEKGWNENNAVIEMYQWRKFNGFGK